MGDAFSLKFRLHCGYFEEFHLKIVWLFNAKKIKISYLCNTIAETTMLSERIYDYGELIDACI